MLLNIINNYSSKYKYNDNLIHDIISITVKDQERKVNSINIILENDEFLRKMKKKYFNKDLYTDVIAFNIEEPNEDIEGEIYVSMDRIIDNAHTLNTSINQELKRIIIHGTLHLLGYKDDTRLKKENMTNLENKYLTINLEKIINNLC